MPGRYNFSSRFARGSDGWFTIGSLHVNTTIGLVLLGLIGMVIRLVSVELVAWLALTREALGGLQLWRLGTWIIPNEVDIWSLLLLYIVYTFGSQLENQVGRHGLLRFIVALTIVPAAVYCVVSIATGERGALYGLNYVELGLLVAFAAQFPWVRFFFGIPAPVMVGIFVALQVIFARGSLSAVALVLTTVAMALLGIRAMGYAPDAHQIPRLTIPGLTPASLGQPQKRSKRGSVSRSGKSSTKKANLRAVPPPGSSSRRTESASSPEIDAILDQINESGFDSLNDEQKAALNQYSQRLRKDRDS